MSAYLRFRVGRQILLADRAAIADVDTVEGALAPVARLGDVPRAALLLDGARLLGEAAVVEGAAHDVVRFHLPSAGSVGADETTWNVVVDRVVRFETIEERAFRPLPRGVGAIRGVVDAVLVEDGGASMALRLRPLDEIAAGPYAHPRAWRRAALTVRGAEVGA